MRTSSTKTQSGEEDKKSVDETRVQYEIRKEWERKPDMKASLATTAILPGTAKYLLFFLWSLCRMFGSDEFSSKNMLASNVAATGDGIKFGRVCDALVFDYSQRKFQLLLSKAV